MFFSGNHLTRMIINANDCHNCWLSMNNTNDRKWHGYVIRGRIYQKKSPDRNTSTRGYPFSYPQKTGRTPVHEVHLFKYIFRQVFLLVGLSKSRAFPVGLYPTSGMLRFLSPITAAGPFPIFTGFPFKLNSAWRNLWASFIFLEAVDN